MTSRDPSIRTRTLIITGLAIAAIALSAIAMLAAEGFGL